MHAKNTVVIAIALIICPVVHAEPGTVGALGAIQSNTILLQAQVREAQAKEELRRLTGNGSVDFSADYKSSDQSSSSLPYATGAGGAYGKFTATFVYSNGNQIEAGVGQKIPGGFKVSSITAEQAVITSGKNTYYLPYGMKPNYKPAEPGAANTGRFGQQQAPLLPGQSGPMPRPALIN